MCRTGDQYCSTSLPIQADGDETTEDTEVHRGGSLGAQLIYCAWP
jgi:hypothetical protein